MENKNQTTIYIGEEEEITSIIDKLKQCECKEVILLVPEEAMLLQNVINLKLLKDKAEELGRNISIVKTCESDDGFNCHRAEENKNKISDKKDNEDNLSHNVAENRAEPNSFLKKRNDVNLSECKRNKAEKNQLSESNKVKVFDIVRTVDNRGAEKKTINIKPTIKKEEENCRSSFETEDDAANKECLYQEHNLSKKTKKVALIPSITSKYFILFILMCSIILCVSMAIILPKADVDIMLKPGEESYDFEFIVDQSINEIDIANDLIPVKKIEVAGEETETYSSTGKKHLTQKASGKITVFNEYSSAPQKIVASTRFLSKDGLLFRIKESIIIPGFSRIEGVDKPGEVVTEVYADKPGEEYNIEPTSFTLPGLQGSAKYSSVYARSFEAMKNGIDKEVLYFSESDYITAKSKLTERVFEKNEKEFLEKISDQELIIGGTKEKDEVKIKNNIDVGNVANNFQMTVTAKESVLVLLKSDTESLIFEKIKSQLDQNMEIIEDEMVYEVQDIVKSENGEIIIPVHVNQKLVAKIDIDKVGDEIAGKTQEELRAYFENMRGVKSTDIHFWPFWVKNVPGSRDKINIKINQ